MSTRAILIPLQSSQSALTLTPELLDTTGAPVASSLSAVVNLGGGFYGWTYTSFPAGFRGFVMFQSAGVNVAGLAINPEEAEDVGLILTDLASPLAANVVEWLGSAPTGPPALATQIVDPWSVSLPGSYAAGTAGNFLGHSFSLNALVTQLTTAEIGAVGTVTNPVTVGTNSDKTGYSLSSSGVDSIQVETGINLRQSLSPILAASAGTITGNATGSPVVKAPTTAAPTRIAATLSGEDRVTTVLTLPT